MKTGILTYHRSHNYGALLQAVALRTVLENLGHNSRFIDYWPDYHRRMYGLLDRNKFHNGGIRLKAGMLRDLIQSFPQRCRRLAAFNNFIKRHIDPYVIPYSGDSRPDAAVYGSDQIWRKQAGLGGKFNPVYFADNSIGADLNIAYAASMGELYSDEASLSFLREKFGKFDALGVREADLAQLMTSHNLGSPEIVLDPTLLLSADDWEKIIEPRDIVSEPYILHYDLMKNSFDLKAIEDYARDRGLKIVTLKGVGTGWTRKKNVVDSSGPADFVNLIRNAETVFTSSYHGLVFALNFNRNVFASFDHNAGRAKSILSDVGLDDHLLPPMAGSIPDIYADWDKVNDKLKKLRSRSIDFLQKSLNP